MSKDIFKAFNPAGTFLLPLSYYLYHNYNEDGDIALFANAVSPQLWGIGGPVYIVYVLLIHIIYTTLKHAQLYL